MILNDGIIKFLKDIDVDLLDPVTLVLSYYFKAETMGQYTQSEFCNGMAELKFISILK